MTKVLLASLVGLLAACSAQGDESTQPANGASTAVSGAAGATPTPNAAGEGSARAGATPTPNAAGEGSARAVAAATATPGTDAEPGEPASPPTAGADPAAATGSLPLGATQGTTRKDPTAASETPWEVDKQGDRIGSVRYRTWIWPTPSRGRNHIAIGTLRLGTSVALKSKEPVTGNGCNDKWYAVEPRGYVCADDTTTFDFDSPYWHALAMVRPGSGPYPYRYAFSFGAPMYSRIPSAEEQRAAESLMGPKMRFESLGKWSEGHERLVTTKPEEFFVADGPIPSFYHGTDPIPGSPWRPAPVRVRTIPAGSGFAYVRIFEAEGRKWLLTPELFLIPADRVWPYKESGYHGVELTGDMAAPFAWTKPAEGVPRYAKNGDEFAAAEGRFEGRKPVFLTGNTVAVGKLVYHEAKDGTFILDDEEVTVVPAKTRKLPYNIAEDEKYLEASILGGVMTAWVGRKAVFTTLWSGGLGGVPVKGNDPKKFATTETGIFDIQWKDRVETMSPDKGAPTVFWFSDVPWIQYVKAPMAMHTSYWHENFGYLMSAECLNTSATDGEWLFQFTEPQVPKDWGGASGNGFNGRATRVVITP